ncbi:Oidioi.mRNA.OKI2018_I69.chr2.g4634.t1.cds [Oikopleura dioica]|uniref:Oidioi.mRNA.OKI2018_I69.chr2.g4634.t1.cds n=1 Tax=Oikopleura dioica TaxID=34765 RepID=A0ABN7SXK1_OIKDI|nr:Oidioi.mRNA.OKI2018_I69.chr2.g4634.t1.cds [Oikopleura dioica]
MKVFLACLIAFSAAQAPTKEQACQDCKAFNNLIKDEAEGPNNNIVKAFLNQINIACNNTSSQPPLCQISLDQGFMNFWNGAAQADPEAWCESYTLCDSNSPSLFAFDHCGTCTTFTDDLSKIAKYDSDWWNAIWSQFTDDFCTNIPYFEVKYCRKEMAAFNPMAQSHLVDIDATLACAAVTIC